MLQAKDISLERNVTKIFLLYIYIFRRRTYRNMEEPMMLCRICELRIPVRNEQRHTTACVQLNEKTKEIEQIDQSLLIIGNEITFSINLARKKM